MRQVEHAPVSDASEQRRIRRRGRLAAVVFAAGAFCTGCNEDEALRAFRDAATSGLQSGFKLISSGIIDGAFAIFQLGAEGASGSASTGSTESSGSTTDTSGTGSGG